MRTTVWSEKSRLTGTYSVRWYDPDTNMKQRVLCGSYDKAKKKILEIKNLLDSRKLGGNTAHPLRLFDQYLEAKKSELRVSTLERKEGIRSFLSRFTAMEQLDSSTIESWKQELASTYKVSTISYLLSALRAFIAWCRQEDLANMNPFEKVKVPAMEQVGRRLTEDEIKRIFVTMEGNLKPLIVLYLETGCRRSELLGMVPNELDLERGCWTIPAIRTKTNQERMVPLTTNALNALKMLEPGWTKERLHKAWKRALHAAQIEGRVRIHDLRHTFASDWKGRGETLKAVCGWTSDHMMGRYKHVRFNEIKEDMRPRGFGGDLGQSTGSELTNG